MTSPDHAAHARELAEACKVHYERVVSSNGCVLSESWYFVDGPVIAWDSKGYRESNPWSPHTNRDHLAVCLREVERRGKMQSLVGIMFEVNQADTTGAWWSPEYLMGLFAHEPAVIAEACWSVLVGKEGE